MGAQVRWAELEGAKKGRWERGAGWERARGKAGKSQEGTASMRAGQTTKPKPRVRGGVGEVANTEGQGQGRQTYKGWRAGAGQAN